MMDELRKLGERIRRERLKYGLTLEEVAKATGLSSAFLSLLENGKINPSLKSLVRICSFFSIHLASLFEEEDDSQNVFHFPKERQVEISSKGKQAIRFLLPKRGFIEPVLITLQPRFESQEFTVHKGVEFGYVFEGIIEVHIKNEGVFVCREGDSILYRADLFHKLRNPTDHIAVGLWIGFPLQSVT